MSEHLEQPPVQQGFDPVPTDFEPFVPEVPQQEQIPAWAQQIMSQQAALEQRLTQPVEDESWRVDNEALEQKLTSRFDTFQQQMAATVEQLVAPSIAEKVVGSIGKGLNEGAQAFIRSQIEGLNPAALQGILKNPQSQVLLRGAAENEHRKTVSTPMPGADPVQNPRSVGAEGLTAAEEAEAQKMFHQLGEVVNGYTIEKARASVQRAKASFTDYVSQGAVKGY